MPHPKDVERRKGILWHLEDKDLTLVDARAIRRHLINTENKKSRITHTPSGYEVWWSK